jgi:hypothetical protein
VICPEKMVYTIGWFFGFSRVPFFFVDELKGEFSMG